MTEGRIEDSGSHMWTAAVFMVAAPFLVILCLILWDTPYPLTEAVAIFENVANRASNPWIPDTAYYRPLFYVTASAIWHAPGSLDARLAALRLVQIVPVIVLIVGLIWHVRPRTFLDAAAASVAVAVVMGSPGFRDNLELPLSYTTVAMPLALIAWVLMNRPLRPWHAPVIVAMTLIAIGFKEQGLALVLLVAACWWTRAPGATRGLAVTVAAIAVVYVIVRLFWHGDGPIFEQAIGLGFREIDVPEATARFGASPLWIYAYNGASTIANALFGEPARGVFRIVHAWSEGRTQAWQFAHVGSSVGLTAVIAWWGLRSLRNTRTHAWSVESRALVAWAVVLLACGLLSFNYSRERLAGMAVVFHGIAAFFALRAAASRALDASRMRFAVAGFALLVLAAAWHTRALATIEYARATAWRNHMEWLVMLPDRRIEFAERPTYLRIMHEMIEQGTDPEAPRPIRYPEWVALTIGQP
jgi:hypothetical protein